MTHEFDVSVTLLQHGIEAEETHQHRHETGTDQKGENPVGNGQYRKEKEGHAEQNHCKHRINDVKDQPMQSSSDRPQEQL